MFYLGIDTPDVDIDRNVCQIMYSPMLSIFFFGGDRGLLTAVQPGSAFQASPELYIAHHDTAPPKHQVILSDHTGHLLRMLTSRKAKEDSRKRPQKSSANSNRRKRTTEQNDAPRESKKSAVGTSNDEAGPSNTNSDERYRASASASNYVFTRVELHGRTLKDLQNILRAERLPVSGRKEELVTRILQHQARKRIQTSRR